MVKNILITGGAGFIGSNLLNFISNENYNVSIIDNFSVGDRSYINNPDIEVLEGNICDLTNIMPSNYRPDYIIHLAAAGNVIDSVTHPEENFHNNVRGTISVLEYSRSVGVEKLFFSSTGGALMGDSISPVSEDSVPNPISPYGASKLACETYIKVYSRCYDIQYVIFRFGNVLGENCLHKKGVVNNFYSNLKTGEKLKIYGDVSRDFIFVEDLCRAIMNSLENDQVLDQIFHLASGIETKIVDVAGYVCEALRINDSSILSLPRRPGEVKKNFANISKAREILGLENSLSTKALVELVVRYLHEKNYDNS